MWIAVGAGMAPMPVSAQTYPAKPIKVKSIAPEELQRALEKK